MSSAASNPIPEFRDADQYWQPIGSSGHEIIRPKPRRPGDASKPPVDPNVPPRLPPRDPQHFGLSPVGNHAKLRSTVRDLGGGSTPILRTTTPKIVNKDVPSPPSAEEGLKSPSREKLLQSPGIAIGSSRETTVTPKVVSRGPTPLVSKGLLNMESHTPPRPPSSREMKLLKDGGYTGPAQVLIARDVKPINSNINPSSEAQSNNRDSKANANNDINSNAAVAHHVERGYNRITNNNLSNVPASVRSPTPIGVGDAVPKKKVVVHQVSSDSADYSSLSKSSSDGDPIVFRKRPSSKPKFRRRNLFHFPHHLSMDELRLMHRSHDSYSSSSSDENRSSGHASMSDSHASSPSTEATSRLRPDHEHGRTSNNLTTNNKNVAHLGGGSEHHRSNRIIGTHRDCYITSRSSPLKVVPEDDKPTSNSNGGVPPSTHGYVGGRNRLRGVPVMAKDDFTLKLEGASGLDDIRQAIEHLTLRSQGSRGSYSTSTYSSMSGSESEPVRRLIRHSSLETINTNVTNADEFVWVDGHNRLVEFQQLPWTNHDVLRGLQHGRTKEVVERVSMEVVPRLSYLLQRALVRIAREIQRFSKALGMCSKHEVSTALKVILSPPLADSCVKACLRSAAMYAVSGDQFRQSKSTRAGLLLSVGKFHRWMCDMALGQFVHEYAAIYFTAAIENLLEEVILQSLPSESNPQLTAAILEHNVANNADLWGLFQPYAHLNSGRTATGVLALCRWPSHSTDSGSGLVGSNLHINHTEVPGQQPASKTLEQNLLATCVGSISELGDLLSRVSQFHLHRQVTGTPSGSRHPFTWSPESIQTLFYFMRCSQLEHSEHGNRGPPQELNYERPYLVLPPLSEWVKVACVHADHRHSQTVDKDDVMQAARLLLPGVDCPYRPFWHDEVTCAQRHVDDAECARRLRVELAFRMLMCGRTDLVPHAMQLLPSTRVNTLNERGLSLLMLACLQGEEALVQILLDAGSDVDIEMPPNSVSHPCANPETQHWTAVSYATIRSHLPIVKLLLEKGAGVEGGTRPGEDKCTVTPLQLASAIGNMELVSLLLAHGAHPFLSTNVRDPLSYNGAAQRGCYSALSVAAAHGQRIVLHKLLSHPHSGSHRDVLSLEEILAEGASQITSDRRGTRIQVTSVKNADGSVSVIEPPQIVHLSKTQMKVLQEAMYHAAENGHLEITLDLRNIGVPWTLHCWMQTLGTASEQQFDNVIDQLLQDFLHVWPEDCSAQFVEECLPLLFTIFRHTKNEGTSLLLADIFSNCYGKEQIKELHDVSLVGGARIDPTYVNNPELSDVQFRVEGRVFYAHKIILVNASPRFKTMLSSKCCDGNPPVLQINDIRYDIFQNRGREIKKLSSKQRDLKCVRTFAYKVANKMVMQYLYKGGCENIEVDQNDILELMASANFFQLDGLLHFCEAKCSKFVDLDNVVSTYIHAKAYNAVQLLEFCQGFLLQNMVALLTYDDSVRRLIFGKKLHNHDVLSGLLLTLQARVKSRNSRSSKGA